MKPPPSIYLSTYLLIHYPQDPSYSSNYQVTCFFGSDDFQEPNGPSIPIHHIQANFCSHVIFSPGPSMTPFPGGFFGETQGIVVKIHNFTPMTGQFQRPFHSPRSTAVKSSSPRQWRPLGAPRPLAGTAGQRRRRRGWDVSVWITVPGVQDVDFNLDFTGMQQSWLLNSLQNPNIYV